MPEMLIEYKGADLHDRAVGMVMAASELASKMFGKEVVWKERAFGDCFGEPDFLITTQITDNDDEYVDLCLKVQAAVLDEMAMHAYLDESVEHWMQRVKGKWGKQKGRIISKSP